MNTFIQTCIAIVFLFPVSAFAATAVVSIDTNKEEINALEATLVLPEDMQISRIETGNSAILVWITEPRQEGHKITFAGITPGGFSGMRSLFTLHGTFYPKYLEEVRFENVRALKNDGTGEQTPITLSLAMTQFRADSEPPEDFVPTIASDSNVFDGKHFLVFTTQDKGSGIKRYEVREGRFDWWKEAKSPYILVHQELNRDIYVKAIDHTGNERIAVIPAVHRNWWEEPIFLAILIMIVLFALAYKKTWLRFTK